jgi:hypothetical protein
MRKKAISHLKSGQFRGVDLNRSGRRLKWRNLTASVQSVTPSYVRNALGEWLAYVSAPQLEKATASTGHVGGSQKELDFSIRKHDRSGVAAL